MRALSTAGGVALSGTPGVATDEVAQAESLLLCILLGAAAAPDLVGVYVGPRLVALLASTFVLEIGVETEGARVEEGKGEVDRAPSCEADNVIAVVPAAFRLQGDVAPLGGDGPAPTFQGDEELEVRVLTGIACAGVAVFVASC